MRIISFALAVLATLAALALPAAAEKRVALVIGNDVYPNLSRREQLHNAINDARAVKATLEGLGFDVLSGENLDRDALIGRLSDFGARLELGDIAFFFYAGHGVSLNGANYILPTGISEPHSAGRDEEERLADLSVAETRVIDRIARSGARVAVVVLDACRDNPLASSGGRSIGAARGLSPPPETRGVITIYSAGTGQQARDRLSDTDRDPNSVFTRVFLRKLKTSGLGLRTAAFETQSEVASLASSAGYDQVPGVYSQIIGEDVFLAGRAPPALTSVAPGDTQQSDLPAAVQTSPEPISLPHSLPSAEEARLPNSTQYDAVVPHPTSAHQSCARRPSANGVIVYCASSVLPPQFGNSYGVQNLFGAASTAWVAGSSGYAIGEWIIVEFVEMRTVTGITIQNGYQKNSDIFLKNSRVKKMELLSSSGAKRELRLEDRLGSQQLLFDHPIPAKWIALFIRDVFPGYKYTDTAISKLDVHYTTE
jgi:hypothetical protein